MSQRDRCGTCRVHRHPICQALSTIESVRSGRLSLHRRYAKGMVLMDGGAKMDSFRILVSGVIKLLHIEPDGHQHIVGLLFPGDYLRPTRPPIARLVAEAATPVELCCFPEHTFELLLRRNATLEPAILGHTLNELDDVRGWARILAHRPAMERIATFLVMLEQRTRTASDVPQRDVLHLPLSRAEIADYLGITIETVSRQLTQLRELGIVDTKGRSLIRIRDWDALQSITASRPSTGNSAGR